MWWIYVILVSSSIAVRCMTVYLRGVETAPSYERIECYNVPTTIYYSSSFKCYDRKRSNLIFFRRIYFFLDDSLPAETLRKRMAEVIKSVRKFPKPKNETKKKSEKDRKRPKKTKLKTRN